MIVALYLAAVVAANLSVAAFGPAASIVNAFLFVGLDLTARDRLHDSWRGRQLWPRMALLMARQPSHRDGRRRDALHPLRALVEALMPLLLLAVAAQSLDLLTYVQAPHLESWLVAPLPPEVVVLVKSAGVGLVLVLASQLRPRGRAVVLGSVIAIGAFGAGCNMAALAA